VSIFANEYCREAWRLTKLIEKSPTCEALHGHDQLRIKTIGLPAKRVWNRGSVGLWVRDEKENHMAEPRAAKYKDVIPASSVIGGSVVNANYEDLGKVEDVVLDASAGRIAYGVLSFGGFLGMGDKYFAIPWSAFQFHMSEGRVVLNIDKKLLEKAPGFDKSNWPNMADSEWATSIYKHYGLTPYWEEVSAKRP
jgi:sporulation protein YlmC with PRC-barrel domain